MDCCSSFHPQVPVTLLNFQVAWCHSCASWRVTFDVWTQTGERATEQGYQANMNFGPFDSVLDVFDWITEHLEDQLLAAGAPWDPRG